MKCPALESKLNIGDSVLYPESIGKKPEKPIRGFITEVWFHIYAVEDDYSADIGYTIDYESTFTEDFLIAYNEPYDGIRRIQNTSE